MKTRLQFIRIISFLLLFFGGAHELMSQITTYTAFKTASYHQTAAAQPVAVDTPDAYFFGAEFFADIPNNITNVAFTTPAGTNYSHDEANISFAGYNSDYFETKTDFDAAFPDGIYVFSINQGSDSGNLTMATNELYSSDIPYFSGDTWTNLQSLDPGQPLTLNWNNFTPNPDANAAYTFIRILDVAANNYVYSSDSLSPATTTINISAGTLNFNSDYRIELIFSDRSDLHNAGFGGEAEAIAGFDNLTYTYFTTIPLILNIAPAGTNVVLSWTNSASDYSLQCTHDLTGGNWNFVTNPTNVIGNQIVVTNAICGSNTFFRLEKSQ
jgi:hypothetical protein